MIGKVWLLLLSVWCQAAARGQEAWGSKGLRHEGHQCSGCLGAVGGRLRGSEELTGLKLQSKEARARRLWTTGAKDGVFSAEGLSAQGLWAGGQLAGRLPDERSSTPGQRFEGLRVCRLRVEGLRLKGGSTANATCILTPQLRQEMEKALECTMCLNLYCEPVTLPCGHSYCRTCTAAWLRTGNRICPLCRSPVVSTVNQMRVSYTLTALCKNLFSDEYERRIQEVEDMLLVPAKGDSLLPVVIGGQVVYPGSRATVFLPPEAENARVLYDAFHNREDDRIIWIPDRLSADQPNGSDSVRVGSLALEVEVLGVNVVNFTNNRFSPGQTRIAVAIKSQSRLKLKVVSRNVSETRQGWAMLTARGKRIEDETDVAEAEPIAEKIRDLIPMVLANVYFEEDYQAHDPEGLSWFMCSILGNLLKLPHDLHAHMLSGRNTTQRLLEVKELIKRIACPELTKGTVLISSKEQPNYHFGGSVVLLYQHDITGSTGIIINQHIGEMASVLYPNGTDSLLNQNSNMTPSLLFGGPVNLGSGGPFTQVLAREVPKVAQQNATEIVDGVYLYPGQFLQRTHPNASAVEIDMQDDDVDEESEDDESMQGEDGEDESESDDEELEQMTDRHSTTLGGTFQVHGNATEVIANLTATFAAENIPFRVLDGNSTSIAHLNEMTDSAAASGEERGDTGASSEESMSCGYQPSWMATSNPSYESSGLTTREDNQELLIHGFAAWCPLQLDREIRTGGWYVCGEVNASEIFSMNRTELYDHMKQKASLNCFNSADYLDWIQQNRE